MEPLATEPLVVLASASPIVGELLGENRISVRHSATGYASEPRRTSAPHTGHRPPPEKPDTQGPLRARALATTAAGSHDKHQLRPPRPALPVSLLLCQEIDGDGGVPSSGVGRLEEVPDAAGEVAFEAADGFFGGLAFGAFAGEVVLGFGVAAGAGDGDAVNGGVDLAVAAAVEAVAVGVAGADRDRGDAGGAGELGVGGEAAGAGDLADELGRGQRVRSRARRAAAARCAATSSAISASSALIVWESSRMRRSSSRAMRTRIVCSARARRRRCAGAQLP